MRIPAKVGFALAGDVPKARAAIRNIVAAINALPPTANANDLFLAIEAAQAKSYQSVFSHPKYGSIESPDYTLMICPWMEGCGSSSLLTTHEDTVTEVDTFDCAGSGEYLFRYIVDDVYTRDLGLYDLITLVTYALKEIKGFDPNVGFNSEFIAFLDDCKSFSRIAGYDINHMENFGSLTKREFFKYMFAMADLRKTDDEVGRAKQLFEDNLINLRRRYVEDKDYREKMLKLMNILTTADKLKISFTFPIKRSAAQKSKGQQ